MPLGYSLFEPFWNRKKKLEILKRISKKEATIWAFFHNLIFISLNTAFFVFVIYLIMYDEIRSDIYILVLIALFSPFVTQSIIRKYLYIKYGYYKNTFFELLGVLGSMFLLFSFLFAMVKISREINWSFIKLFISFVIEYCVLIIIGLLFWKPKKIPPTSLLPSP